MKVQELSHPEISVLACYEIEEPNAAESISDVANIPVSSAPKLRSMRIICLADCSIPE